MGGGGGEVERYRLDIVGLGWTLFFAGVARVDQVQDCSVVEADTQSCGWKDCDSVRDKKQKMDGWKNLI